MVAEDQVDAGLEAVQPTLLHQVEAELAKAEPGLVVAEQPSQHGAERWHRRCTIRRCCHAPG